MKRVILACIASACVVPAVAGGTAVAATPQQDIGQSADSRQAAGSSATSTQTAPTNENISVRIMSPGNDGAVTQTNSSSAASAAGNTNSTGQQAQQVGAAQQAIGQSAGNAQAALSKATSVQDSPTNENISVRIMSPGDAGAVRQENRSSAQSAAGNDNTTEQSAAQAGAGAATQAIGQDASNAQKAGSEAVSRQDDPVNRNISVRIKSPGNDGAVSQSNSSSAMSAAGNDNATTQQAAQTAGGPVMLHRGCDDGCHASKPTVQAIGQDADSRQEAGSRAFSHQDGALNENFGGAGSVSQENSSMAVSAAGNDNWTKQAAEQHAGLRAPAAARLATADRCDDCHPALGTVVQAIGQHAGNWQDAWSEAKSEQVCPVNLNGSLGMPFGHKGKVATAAAPAAGSVSQSNTSKAESASGNDNATDQRARQDAWPWIAMVI